jgi:amino acid transporter
VFARVHPTKRFPHVSLLVIGLISLPFCFFTLGQLVSWLMQVQILLRFVWQCAAVILLHEYRKDIAQPFRMWLYPAPALVSLLLWLYLFFTGPREGIAFSFAFLAVAVASYFGFVRSNRAAVRRST